MTNNQRVFNITRGFSLKYKQAVKAIDLCTCEWVEFGRSVKDLTLAESIKRRNMQKKEVDILPHTEIPGLIFEPPTNSPSRQNSQITIQANEFFRQAIA
jgi:hypothetical protein